MPYRWPEDTQCTRIALAVEEQWCRTGGGALTMCDQRPHRVFTLNGPLPLVCQRAHCPTRACPAPPQTRSPEAETAVAMPWWVLGWEVVWWLGQRRCARHWSVGPSRAARADTSQMRLSADALEPSSHRDPPMLAARRQAPDPLAAAEADVAAVRLASAGLPPAQGQATLSGVRALERTRVWCAAPLLCSATPEVQPRLVQARVWTERLGTRVRLWLSAQQDACVRGIAAAFPGVPPRYGAHHLLRDGAKPVLEAASRAKVKMRRTVRGVRARAREVGSARRSTALPGRSSAPLEERRDTWEQRAEPQDTAVRGEAVPPDVVLEYGAAVRGLLHDAPGGPLHPPGLCLAEALGEVQASRQRNLEAQKGGRRTTDAGGGLATSTGG
jgi:hypothetical protein